MLGFSFSQEMIVSACSFSYEPECKRFLLLIPSATLAFSLSSPAGLALDVAGGGGGCCCGRCGICDFNPRPSVPSPARPVRGQPEEMPDAGLERGEDGKRAMGEAEQPSPGRLIAPARLCEFIDDVVALGTATPTVAWTRDFPFPFSQGPRFWRGCGKGFGVAGLLVSHVGIQNENVVFLVMCLGSWWAFFFFFRSFEVIEGTCFACRQ